MFLPHSQSWRLPSQMRKSWEFASGTRTYIGTAIFAPHERSLRMANMTAAFIVGGLAPRAERLDGAVEAALQAFGSRAAAEPILSGLSSGFSAHSHQRSKERRANFKRVLFQRQFTDKLHDAIFDDIGFNADP